MLKSLYDWRVGCTAQQLSDFEAALAPVCQHAIRQKTLEERYNGRYHCALLNKKILSAAIQYPQPDNNRTWTKEPSAGERFAHLLADSDGVIVAKYANDEFNAACVTLKKRGLVFEHDDHLCLPAELVLMLRKAKQENEWFSLCFKLPKALLQGLIPVDLGHLASCDPLQIEMVAWVVCEGVRSIKQVSLRKILDKADLDFLGYLYLHGGIASVKLLQRFCSDAIDARQLHARLASEADDNRSKTKSAMESALEEHFPKRLRKLLFFGLLGLIVKNNNDSSTRIVLSAEGEQRIQAFLDEALNRIADQEKASWNGPDCKIGFSSPWRYDHNLWRIWVALHFMPVRRTQQGHLGKMDLKKLAALLHLKHDFLLNHAIECMLTAQFLCEMDAAIAPANIHWQAWGKRQLSLMLSNDSSEQEQRMATALLLKLPTEQWLNLEKVEGWLKAKSKITMPCFQWGHMFTRLPEIHLHHLDPSRRYIYFLPAFHAVLKGEKIPFDAPGWLGGEATASTAGFINAAGDIQLPPDFSHSVLQKLTPFCTLNSVEQFIELRINQKFIALMDLDKSKITACKELLESIQLPLPQAIAYLFDKKLAQQPMARVESTSLLALLYDVSNFQRLQSLGFPVRQPFPELPQIALLEDVAHAQDFIAACQQAGIALEIGMPPTQWIEGVLNISAWLAAHEWQVGQWLEIYYQEDGGLEQFMACMEESRYYLLVRKALKKKRGYTLIPGLFALEAYRTFRLRELDADEINRLGLDKLL